MTFKKKTESQAEQAQAAASAWKYEDGLTVDSPPEIRQKWMAEYKRRLKEVLPKHDVKSALFNAEKQ